MNCFSSICLKAGIDNVGLLISAAAHTLLVVLTVSPMREN